MNKTKIAVKILQSPRARKMIAKGLKNEHVRKLIVKQLKRRITGK